MPAAPRYPDHGDRMRARAEDRAGDFSLTSVDPRGTQLTWTVPIPATRNGR